MTASPQLLRSRSMTRCDSSVLRALTWNICLARIVKEGVVERRDIVIIYVNVYIYMYMTYFCVFPPEKKGSGGYWLFRF